MSGSPSEPPWHLTETYKSLITLAVEALKMLAIVNGGAAIAVLTYLGNLAGRPAPGVKLPDMTSAILWYCGGLTAAITAFVIAYVTQLCLYNEGRKRRSGYAIRQWHAVGVWICVALAFASVGAFSKGCWVAAHVLGTVKGG